MNLKAYLLKAHAIVKATTDKHRRDVQYNVNYLVYVKLKPYRIHSLAKKPNEKLGTQYFGPFKITKRIGIIAYQLELPPKTSIYPIFHMSQLKKALGPSEVC